MFPPIIWNINSILNISVWNYIIPQGVCQSFFIEKQPKLVQQILSGRQDASINFSGVVSLMQNMGFTLRSKGSHHIFYRTGVDEIINIQPGGK
jgi:hypothetical protein